MSMGRRATDKTRLFMGIAGSILLAGCSLHPSKDIDFAFRCDSLKDGMPVVDALRALRIDRDSETMERVLGDSGDVVVFSEPRGRCSCLFTIAEGRVLKPRSRCESPTYSDVALMSPNNRFEGTGGQRGWPLPSSLRSSAAPQPER